VTGLLSEKIIAELHTQKAFVSCSGFTVERGMTEVHLAEAQLKRKAIESAQQVFALVDSSKLGAGGYDDICPPLANNAPGSLILASQKSGSYDCNGQSSRSPCVVDLQGSKNKRIFM